jgi:hypothetical protein
MSTNADSIHERQTTQSVTHKKGGVYDKSTEVHPIMHKTRKADRKMDRIYRQLLGYLADTEDTEAMDILTLLEDSIVALHDKALHQVKNTEDDDCNT